MGDSVTMADCCLVPQVFNARRYNVDLEQFPRISQVEKRLAELDDFIRAHPREQPDCPDELK